MRFSQVANMNVVAHTGSIACRVVAAENGNVLNFSLRCF